MVNWEGILGGGCGGGRIGALSYEEMAEVRTFAGELCRLTQNKRSGAEQSLINYKDNGDDTVMEAILVVSRAWCYIHPSEIEEIY